MTTAWANLATAIQETTDEAPAHPVARISWALGDARPSTRTLFNWLHETTTPREGAARAILAIFRRYKATPPAAIISAAKEPPCKRPPNS